MSTCLQLTSQIWRILKETGHKIYCFGRHSLWSTYLVPWACFYLRKFEFCVIGIHTTDFLSRWSTQNLQEVTVFQFFQK
ncbi:Os06g0547933 [Oryza sativa Japonica Group]|uniref:Os06g0547933 protein n=1 Tax=Oryza sativa subsp. japonica TaxID=39947 RepID=A0A0P0WXI4_ORYSJ|nr:Os06g0547933 [Oryza sativa Japonica Group]